MNSDEDVNTNISSHILIRDKTTGQEFVNKRLIQPKVKKEDSNECKNPNNNQNITKSYRPCFNQR